MHRIGSRSYVGQPGETVTVTTAVSDRGQASVFVNDVDMGPSTQFQLPSEPGNHAEWKVQLSGKQGETCVPTIVVVDGSFDDDFLICTVHDPLPVHLYKCAVARPSAMRALSRMRGKKGAAKKKTTRKKATTKRGAAKKSKKRGRS